MIVDIEIEFSSWRLSSHGAAPHLKLILEIFYGIRLGGCQVMLFTGISDEIK